VSGYRAAFTTVKTTEEDLVDQLIQCGPVVAIGKPGEKLQTLGAARMYVDDAEWQAVVLGLIKKAGLIILRPGRSAGFWWEVKQVREIAAPKNVVFYFASGDDLLAFQECALSTVAEAVNWIEAAAQPSHNQLDYSAFLLFSDGWRPKWIQGENRNVKKLVREVIATATEPNCQRRPTLLTDATIEKCPYCESIRGSDSDGYCLGCKRPIC
jgi:hypothetical protein